MNFQKKKNCPIFLIKFYKSKKLPPDIYVCLQNGSFQEAPAHENTHHSSKNKQQNIDLTSLLSDMNSTTCGLYKKTEETRKIHIPLVYQA